MDDDLVVSRRRILGAAGSAGLAAAGAGFGSSGFLNDEETVEANQIVAGTFDLRVDWAVHYSDWSEDERVHAHLEDGEVVVDDPAAFLDTTLDERIPDAATREAIAAGELDPCEPGVLPNSPGRPVLELTDVKPGDLGRIRFSLHPCGGPGYLWLQGTVHESGENGLTAPEEAVDSSSTGELTSAIQTRVWYDDGEAVRGSGPEPLAFPTDGRSFAPLAELLNALRTGNGLPLDGDPSTDEWACHGETTSYLVVEWELPFATGNAVQTDTVRFDLGFYAEQCRRNAVTPAGGETT